MFDFTKGVLWKAILQVLSSEELFLLDSNQVQTVRKHPSFRLFAAMNPAHEVGKKALPKRLERLLIQIEFDPVKEKSQVISILRNYFRKFKQIGNQHLEQLAEFYCQLRVRKIQI